MENKTILNKTGNLGRTALINRMVTHKAMNTDENQSTTITYDELAEISLALQLFDNLLTNLNSNRNRLEGSGLISVFDEMKEYHSNFDDKETKKSIENVF